MSEISVTLRDLLESGVHYGHTTRRWNPKMAPYIFGERNGIHIMDLRQTLPMLEKALEAVRHCASRGGRILFVGTKHQAANIVKDAAERCGQYYINHRWLGGTLTNWKTVNQSIKRMKEMAEILENPGRMTKKEILKMRREYEKLQRALGGVSEMGGLPDMVFVVDTNKEDIAVLESVRLNIPVIAVVDSNSNPDNITYPVPGNDDATRAIALYCDLMSKAVLEGLQAEMLSAGVDIGASEDVLDELAGEKSDGARKADANRRPAPKGKPGNGKPQNGRPAAKGNGKPAPAKAPRKEETATATPAAE